MTEVKELSPNATGSPEEQQVTEGSVSNVGVESDQAADQYSEAQQYERFENNMLFGSDTFEAKNEALLSDLVKNKCNINNIDLKKIDRYAFAINATFRSTMIQGLANRSIRFDRMILIGNACISLKYIVKSIGLSWEDSVEKHFGPELLSTIGTYMRLAKIKGVSNHSYLGKDRILKVYSVGKKLKNISAKSIDIVGDILHQLKIVPINSLFDDVQMFNRRVDASIFAHKVELNGITVRHQCIIDLASTKFNFKNSNKHLKAMSYLKDNSENPNDACQKYLDNILKNNGIYNASSLIEENDEQKGENDFIDSIKVSYAAIRTSFQEGTELSLEVKTEIKILVDYLNGLMA